MVIGFTSSVQSNLLLFIIMLFEDLKIIEPILRALKQEGYTTPTPIQQQAIPLALAQRDVLGCAQTGTGKTAAFSIPILQLLSERTQGSKGNRPIKALILTPTRELAIQIEESIDAYGRNLGWTNPANRGIETWSRHTCGYTRQAN